MKLLYITNIPTPYRNARFEAMERYFQDYDIEFEVVYMASTESNRSWKFEPDAFKYPCCIYRGIHPKIGGVYFHFNIGILLRLLRRDYDLIVIGGISAPTLWMALCLPLGGAIRVLSIESNLASTRVKHGLIAWIKKILIRAADAYQVTGMRQIEFVRYFLGSECEKRGFVMLPNVVDEKRFDESVRIQRLEKERIRSQLGIPENKVVWLLPARISPEKGVIPFLESLPPIENVVVVVAGDGPQFEDAIKIVKSRSLNVVFKGFVDESAMVDCYAVSDLVIIPSLRDASPLVAIEACAAGLALCVSDRIGNVCEVLVDGLNGWKYDPTMPQVYQSEHFAKIALASIEELQSMGVESYRIYKETFAIEPAVRSYAKQLSKLAKGKND